MKCDNNFCIYNDEYGSCMLDEIVVNACGMCAECIQITLTREEREEKRANMLRAIIERERGDIEVELTEEDIDKLLS